MGRAKTLRQEVEELREELAAVVAKRVPAKEDAAASVEQHVKELIETVQKALESAESEVGKHTVAAVAGALVLGVVIGRLMR